MKENYTFPQHPESIAPHETNQSKNLAEELISLSGESQKPTNTQELLAYLTNPQEQVQSFSAIEHFPDFLNRLNPEDRLKSLEAIAGYFTNLDQLNLHDLYLLGSLLNQNHLKTDEPTTNNILSHLVRLEFGSELTHAFRQLSQPNNHKLNSLLHTTLRPIEEILKRQAREVEENTNVEESSFSSDVFAWVDRQEFVTKNYLLRCRLQDLKTLAPFDGETEDQEVGDIRFGQNSELIFGVRSLPSSHLFREALNITDTHIIQSPITDLSQRTIVRYHNGQAEEVFLLDIKEVEDWVYSKREVLKANTPPHFSEDYLSALEKIQVDIENQGYQYHSSSEQLLSQNFLKEYFQQNPNAYIDILELQNKTNNQISVYNLAEILMHNEEVFGKHIALANRPEIKPLSQEEHFKRIFPYQQYSQDKYNEYLFYISPSMRERYTQEVGLDITQIPEYAQVWFIDFLNKCKMDNLVILSHTLKHRKNPEIANNLATAFFACAENPDYAQNIQDLPYRQDLSNDELLQLLKKYQEIVEKSLGLEGTINEILSQQSSEANHSVIKIAKSLQRTANELLVSFSQSSKSATELFKDLNSLDIELLEQSKILKEYHKEHSDKLLTGQTQNIHNLSQDTKKQISKLVALTRQERGEVLKQKVTSNLEALFEHRHKESADNIEFLLFYTKATASKPQKLVGCIEIDTLKNNQGLYLGSFSIHPEFQSSGLASLMLTKLQALEVFNKPVTIDVHSKNQALLRAYRLFGFKPQEEIPNYSGIEGETYIRMQYLPEAQEKLAKAA